jgi:alpha-tubulin suppressor-like RCC1 family protein
MVVDNKRLWGWGTGSNGDMGLIGAVSTVPTPTLSPEFIRRDVHEVRCGYAATFAIVGADRELWATGRNSNRQAGTGATTVVYSFERCIDMLGEFIVGVEKVATLNAVTVILLGGVLYFAGNALPVGAGGSGTNYPTFREVTLTGGIIGQKIVDIANGYDHFIVLTEKGEVWGRGGNNTYNQLTNAAGGSDWKKLAFSGTPGKIVKIFAGANSSMALDDKGVLYACGQNAYTHFGDGTNQAAPATLTSIMQYLPVGSKVKLAAISEGWTHVILEDGTGYYAGNSTRGQSGLSSSYNTSTWVKVPTLVDVEQIYCSPWNSSLSTGAVISRNSKGEVYVAGNGAGQLTDFNTTADKVNFTNLLHFPRTPVRPPDPNLYPKADDFSMGRGKFFEDLTKATPGLAEWDGTLKITGKAFGQDWPEGSNITCGILLDEENIMLSVDSYGTTGLFPDTRHKLYKLNLATGAFVYLGQNTDASTVDNIIKQMSAVGKDLGIWMPGTRVQGTAAAHIRRVSNFNENAPTALAISFSEISRLWTDMGADYTYPVGNSGICVDKGKWALHGGANGAIALVDIEATTNPALVYEILTTGNTPFRSEVAIGDRGGPNGWIAFIGYNTQNMLCYYPHEGRTVPYNIPALANYGAIGSIDYYDSGDHCLLAPAGAGLDALPLLVARPWGSYTPLAATTPYRFMGAKTIGNGIGVMLPHVQRYGTQNDNGCLAIRHNGVSVQMQKLTQVTRVFNQVGGALHKGVIYRGNKLHWFTPRTFWTAELVGVKPPPIEYQLHPYLNHT